MTDAVVVELATIRAKQDSLAEQTKAHQEEITVIKNGINSLNMTCSSMGSELRNVAQTIAKLNDNVSEFGKHWVAEKNTITDDLHNIKIKDVSQDAKIDTLKLELTATSSKARYALLTSVSLAVAFGVTILLADIFGAHTAGQFAAGINQATKH